MAATTPNFVLSVGGFHPSFKPPPLPFPSPRRIAIDILNEPTARASASRATSPSPRNTVQFGARGRAALRLRRVQHRGPPRLRRAVPVLAASTSSIEISASVSLKVFGVGLFSVRLRFELEGPDAVAGAGHRLDLAAVLRDLGRLRHHLGRGRTTRRCRRSTCCRCSQASSTRRESWRALLPPAATCWSSLRTLGRRRRHAGAAPARHAAREPAARAARPDRRQGRQPAARPTPTASAVSVDRRRAGRSVGDVDEPFAPAQFQDLDDAAKLSRPAFEPQHGGIELAVAGAPARVGARWSSAVVRYEQIIDRHRLPALRPPLPRLRRPACSTHFLRGNARQPLAALAARAAASCQPFDDVDQGRAPRRYAVALTARQHAPVERRSSPARRWRATHLGALVRRRPDAGRRAARHPGLRGDGRHERPIGTLLVPALAAAGARQPDHRARRRPGVHARASPCRSSSS